MKTKQFSIIGAIVVVIAAGMFGLINMGPTAQNTETINTVQNELVVEPEPPTNTRTESIGYNSGISVSESELMSKSSLAPAKFDNLSKAKLGNAQLVLSDIRVRDNGNVHYVYGPSNLRITDDTSIREIYQSGALQIKTNSLVNKESTFDALANYFKDEVKYINNIPTLIKEFDDGYELELYTGDDQVIIIGAKASLAELEQVVVNLGIENKGLDLKQYVVENWEMPRGESSPSIEDPPVEP